MYFKLSWNTNTGWAGGDVSFRATLLLLEARQSHSKYLKAPLSPPAAHHTRGRRPKAGAHRFDFRCDLAAMCEVDVPPLRRQNLAGEILRVSRESLPSPPAVLQESCRSCVFGGGGLRLFSSESPLVSPALLLFSLSHFLEWKSKHHFCVGVLEGNTQRLALAADWFIALAARRAEFTKSNTLWETLTGNLWFGEVNRVQWGVWGFLLIALYGWATGRREQRQPWMTEQMTVSKIEKAKGKQMDFCSVCVIHVKFWHWQPGGTSGGLVLKVPCEQQQVFRNAALVRSAPSWMQLN